MGDEKRPGQATAPDAIPGRESSPSPTPWRTPRFEVIALDCEISAYAPAGDEPLF